MNPLGSNGALFATSEPVNPDTVTHVLIQCSKQYPDLGKPRLILMSMRFTEVLPF